MTIEEMIAVLQAWRDGKTIEFREHGSERWVYSRPNWNFEAGDYRVKPEAREWWICNGFDKETWVVVENTHKLRENPCPGEMVKVREVL